MLGIRFPHFFGLNSEKYFRFWQILQRFKNSGKFPQKAPRCPLYIPKISQYVPQIFPIYPPDIPEISPRYSQYIPQIFPIYPRDISKIFPIYPPDIPNLSSRYPPDIPKISQEIPLIFPEISPRYPPIYHQNIPNPMTTHEQFGTLKPKYQNGWDLWTSWLLQYLFSVQWKVLYEG